MKYVNMNEVAFDAAAVAFPGLGNCHGVVYLTSAGLFAFHIFGGYTTTANRAPFFGDFVKRHPQGATAAGLRLYGVCPTNRYGAPGLQKAELQVCAQALGFAGPIEGGMWDIATLNWTTTYAECARMGDAVQTRIEDFTNQPTATGANPNHLDHRAVRVVQNLLAVPPTLTSGSLKPTDMVTTGVTRKPATPNFILVTNVL